MYETLKSAFGTTQSLSTIAAKKVRRKHKFWRHFYLSCPRSYLAYATLISTFYYYNISYRVWHDEKRIKE